MCIQHAICNKQYDLNRYRDLYSFGNEIYNGKLSSNEAKDKQKEMLNLIDELEEKLNPNRPGPKLRDKNKKSMEEVIKNARQLYKIRNNIVI